MVATQWATLRAFPVEELEGESLPEALFHRADSHHLVSPRPPSVVDASRSACCCSPPEINLPESCVTALAKGGTRNLLLWTGCDDFVRFGGRLSEVLGWKCHRKDTCKRPVKTRTGCDGYWRTARKGTLAQADEALPQVTSPTPAHPQCRRRYQGSLSDPHSRSSEYDGVD